MNVGDPKKAVLLLAVAVLAIGFAIFRAIPKGEAAATRTAEASTATGDGPGATGLPENLLLDPFSHPDLALAMRREEGLTPDISEEMPDRMSSGGNWQPPSGFSGNGGTKPWLPDIELGISGPSPKGGGPRAQGSGAGQQSTSSSGNEEGGVPKENTGSNQQEQQETPTSIRLTAIVDVEEAVAYISVNGTKAVRCKPGMQLTKDVKLLSIEDISVTVSHKGERVKLAVGKSYPQ